MARQAKFGPHRYEYELGKRNYSFAAQVDRIFVNTDKKLNLVQKQALINIIEEMQTPVSKGGKMHVDTGFLRASGQASLNGMPTGQSIPSKTIPQVESNATLIIGQMQLGSTLFWGWTANYAKYREAYDAFMYSAIQNWQKTVDNVVAEAKKRFG